MAERRSARLEDRVDGGLRIELDSTSVPVRVDTRAEREGGGTLTRVCARIVDASPEQYALAPSGAQSNELEEVGDDRLEEVGDDRLEGLATHYALRSSDPDRTAHRFGSEQRARIERLMPQRIEASDGEVRIDVSDLEGDDARLTEAMELATELAARQAKSAYRA